MKQDVVSIIIPIYCVEKYLDKCVASVCNQTYPHLQIILVDDGSPDECPQMCDAWAAKDSRIQVIHKQNGGLSDARNAGLDVAIGKYIYFLDSDDYIEHNLIETALQYMEDDVDMVAFQCIIHKANGTTYTSSREIGKYSLPDDKKRIEFTIDTLLQSRIGWDAWSRLYLRENIERHGLRFVDNKEIFAEDLYFCLCYCAHASQVICIPDALYHYILREDSIMSNNTARLNVGRMNRLAMHVKAYYEKTGDCQGLLELFPIIHYYIIFNVLTPAMSQKLLLGRQGREKLISDIEDYQFFTDNIRYAIKNYKQLEKNDSGRGLADKINYLKYVLDGNYPMFALRSRYLNRFADRIDKRMGYTARWAQEAKLLAREHYDIYLIGTEDFGNIGDHQIAQSILSFLKQEYPRNTIKEISATFYPRFREALIKSIQPGALIILPGGGNLGDVYPATEDLRQDVIKTWRNNTKIVFPQTINFTNTEKGSTYLKKAKEIYTSDNNVILITREDISFSLAKKYFTCESMLIPDIVLSNCRQTTDARGDYILFVLRSDQEKVVSIDLSNLPALKERPARRLDHQQNSHITLERRAQTVEWVFEQYQKASLVITDRLHGMIFSAITGTPCVAFSSYDHKIPGTYKWLTTIPYIRFVESRDDANKAAEELLKMSRQTYDKTLLKPYFDELAQKMKKYVNG